VCLRVGRWFPWAFAAAEPPEGWPPSPAEEEEGLVSEKPLPQMVPL